jgi:S-adenosylmethionine:tRNA ribosyltransferase-isomerase
MQVPDYDLPPAAIAQVPAEPRDSARLLVALGGQDEHPTPQHLIVADLPDLLNRGDVIVVNTSRVMPARLRLRKETGGSAEVLLLEPAGQGTWEVLVRPGRRLAPGTVLHHGSRPVLEVGERLADGRRLVRSLLNEAELADAGELALPPYIHRPLADPTRYQTVYAERPGSVAAPTAGLHITTSVLDRCRERGAHVVGLDLAVGLGTFRPVKAENAEDHVMHAEHYRIPEATWEAVRDAKGRVLAVGTTTLRALESAAATGLLQAKTELYIRPGHVFSTADLLMTNFHQPRSTLLLMLEAFCGPRWRELYREALAEGYRFLSFGDAMLVHRYVPS